MKRAFVKPRSWLLGALCVVVVLGFFFGLLTLAGGGIFVVAMILPLWAGLLYYSRRTSLMRWLVAMPFVIYALLLAIGLVVQEVA